MPIYEYSCVNQHTFEKREGFNANTTVSCPVCDATADRVLHVPSVHYKGSGFYTTDYGRSSSYTAQSDKDNGVSKDDSLKQNDNTDTSSPENSESGAKKPGKKEGKTNQLSGKVPASSEVSSKDND